MEIKQLNVDEVEIYKDALNQLMHACMEEGSSISIPETFYENKFNALRLYLNDGKAALFGAIEDNEMLGFLWTYELKSEYERKYHVAYGAVSEAATGRGIFTALMDASEKYAKSLGISEMELLVSVSNESVIKIHSHHGYQIERVVMKKKI